MMADGWCVGMQDDGATTQQHAPGCRGSPGQPCEAGSAPASAAQASPGLGAVCLRCGGGRGVCWLLEPGALPLSELAPLISPRLCQSFRRASSSTKDSSCDTPPTHMHALRALRCLAQHHALNLGTLLHYDPRSTQSGVSALHPITEFAHCIPSPNSRTPASHHINCTHLHHIT